MDTPNTPQPPTPPVPPGSNPPPGAPVPPTPQHPADPTVPPVPPPPAPALPEAPSVPAAPEAPAVPPVPPPPPAPAPTSVEVPATPPVAQTPPSTQPQTPESAPQAAPEIAPATPAAPTDASKQDVPEVKPADGSTQVPQEAKKSMTKPILLMAGLLVVGASSAVFMVSTMKTGETQSRASEPTAVPVLQTVASPTMAMKTDPNLTITSPTQNAQVSSPSAVISGKTFPNAEVAVNEVEVVSDATGMFTAPVTLDEGENTIVVTANDESGNAAEQELMLTYQPTE